MGLPRGFSLRPPHESDVERIVAVMNEETEALFGVAMVSDEWLTNPWTTPGVDLEHDFAVVVTVDGSVAGYLAVEGAPPYSEVFTLGVVALPFRGRGLGAALLAETERRARRLVDLAPPDRRVVAHAGTLCGAPGVEELFTAHGYGEVRRFCLMRLEFSHPPQPPTAVAGIEIRPLEPGGEAAVYDCMSEAFADHWGATWPEREVWLHRHGSGSDRFDPGLWLLAWQGDELAGALTAQHESDEDANLGYVSQLGVRREFRGRGIGEALLRAGFVVLQGRGRRGACLHVDSQSVTGAARLYERVGMTTHPRFAIWERELRPGTPAPS